MYHGRHIFITPARGTLPVPSVEIVRLLSQSTPAKMTCAAASSSACRIRQLKKLVIKAGRRCSDAILVDLYELNYCDVVDVDAVRSATRAVVAEVRDEIVREVEEKALVLPDQASVHVRGLGKKLVGIDRIASLTIGRALQDEFDANNSSGAGVVDWDQYGLYRSEKESGTAVITISVQAMEEAADGSKPAKRPARAPGCNSAQLYADPQVSRTLSPDIYIVRVAMVEASMPLFGIIGKVNVKSQRML